MSLGIPEVPANIDMALRRFLIELRKAVLSLHGEDVVMAPPGVAPRPVTNLSATGAAGGIIVQFTRSDGDTYILYRNTTPTMQGAGRFDLGNAGIYSDEIGKSAETRHYWVRAKKGMLESSLVGPVSATTLGLAVEITPPEPPPPVDEPVMDDETGFLRME